MGASAGRGRFTESVLRLGVMSESFVIFYLGRTVGIPIDAAHYRADVSNPLRISSLL
jgi:hypothetical protein